MRRIVTGLFLASLLTGTGGVRAEDGEKRPPTLEEVAAAVIAACDARAAAALERLALSGDRDPWLVVDELHHAGRLDAAEVYVPRAPDQIREDLTAYLSQRRGQEADEDARTAFVAGMAALRAGQWATAFEATQALEAPHRSAYAAKAVAWRAHALRGLGRLEESTADFDLAAEAALEIRWLGHAGYCFRQAAKSAAAAGDWQRSLVRRQRALEVYEEFSDPVLIGRTVLAVGSAHEHLGQLEEALAHFERARSLFEQLRNGPGFADALYCIAKVHGLAGRYRQELDYVERGVKVSEALGHRVLLARGLVNQGGACLHLGRFREALSAFQRALPMARAAGDPGKVAITLSNMGIIHLRLGEYAGAFDALRRALAEAEQAKDWGVAASVVQNLGVLHKRLGEPDKAHDHYVRALALAERAGDGPHVASLLANVAGSYERRGQLEEAEACYRRAVRLAQTLGNPRDEAQGLLELSHLLASRGEVAGAEAAVRRAQEISATLESPLDLAVVHALLGDLFERTGQAKVALAEYETALEHLDGATVPELQSKLLRGVARVHLRQGAPRRAALVARRAIETITGLSAGLAEEEGARTRERFADVFDVGVRAAVQSDDLDALAWFFEHGRAGGLREGLGARDALAAAIVPAELHEEFALARLAETRAIDAHRAATQSRNLRALRAAKRDLEAAQEALQVAVAHLQRDAKRAAAIVCPDPDDLDTIRNRLDATEALVYFGLTTEDAVALVVRHTGARLVSLGPTSRLEAAIDRLLLDEEPYVDPDGVSTLRTLAVRPLGIADDIRRVLVSPMGRLGVVPFALLFPEREIVYVASGTTHGMLLADAQQSGEGVLGLGDPAYGTVARVTDSPHRGRYGAGLVRLPGTRVEIEAVATESLLGSVATETRFSSAVGARDRWRSVHFACHGLIDPERPLLSSLALTPDEKTDGFLTCLEIFRMQVPADLVVLSACETGRGRIFRTEGILGLPRAFLFAGTPRVLCSLWMVDDEATRVLMTRFYESWRPGEPGGMGAAAALEAAQAHVRSREGWEHPYYWAAWVLWGVP